MSSHGFLLSQADHSLFYKHAENNKISTLIVYVDDIFVTGDDETSLAYLKKE